MSRYQKTWSQTHYQDLCLNSDRVVLNSGLVSRQPTDDVNHIWFRSERARLTEASALNPTGCRLIWAASAFASVILPVLVHGQVTIIFVVSVCLFVCLSVCLFVQSFSQPSSIRFGSN